jgi:hypothetical protein
MAWSDSWGTHRARKERERHLRGGKQRAALDADLIAEEADYAEAVEVVKQWDESHRPDAV